MIVWSYGGGVQSACIGVLIREGRLPVPDLAVIADTSREKRSTWDYLRDVMQPYLEPTGLVIEVAGHDGSRVDLYASDGDILMPAYTSDGRLPAFCSGEWKRDVIERWLRKKGVKECESWIGFSIDEMRRVPRKDHRPWCKLRFPLIDLMLNRAMCQQVILDAGLPLPHKSRCLMCPHQNDTEWQEVRDDPEEWAQAVAIDREVRANDPDGTGLYLHHSRVPLELASLAAADTPRLVCDSAACYT